MLNTVLEERSVPVNIPPELYRSIVEHTWQDMPTLCSLSLTCRLLRHEAERLLYARISLDPFSSHAPTATNCEQRQILFLNTILHHNPRLASLVREYTSNTIVAYGNSKGPSWDLTKRALKCMVNLKVLDFRMHGGHAAAEDLLVGCPFRLEKLCWGSHSNEEAMATVLVEQQDLKELQFTAHRDGLICFPIHRTACPNLVSLTGNRDIIEALLPGRRVRKLAWVPDIDDRFLNPVLGIEDELGALHTLSFGGYFIRPDFAFITHQLRSLELLEFVGPCSAEGIGMYKQGEMDNRSLTRSQTLAISGGSFPIYMPC